MSLRSLERLTRTLSFRLNAWYAFVFVASTAGLYLLLYFLLSSTIEKKDREVIETQIKEFAAIYQASGLRGMQLRAESTADGRKSRSYFIRMVDPQGKAYIVSVPPDWVEYESSELQIGNYQLQVKRPYVRLPKDNERDWTIGSYTMMDGVELQVGRSRTTEKSCWSLFAKHFSW